MTIDADGRDKIKTLFLRKFNERAIIMSEIYQSEFGDYGYRITRYDGEIRTKYYSPFRWNCKTVEQAEDESLKNWEIDHEFYLVHPVDEVKKENKSLGKKGGSGW